MVPHYYLMRCKKILRLESDMAFDELPLSVREQVLVPDDVVSLDQNQANWRVVIFRDEILELEEYLEWLKEPESLLSEDEEIDLVAN
jgi:hypothetical protein